MQIFYSLININFSSEKIFQLLIKQIFLLNIPLIFFLHFGSIKSINFSYFFGFIFSDGEIYNLVLTISSEHENNNNVRKDIENSQQDSEVFHQPIGPRKVSSHPTPTRPRPHHPAIIRKQPQP